MARLAERLGTPGTVTLLGALVLVGLCAASLVIIRQSTIRSRDARNAVEVVAVSDAGFTLLAALEHELGLAGLALATGDPEVLDALADRFVETDAALDQFSARVRELNAPRDDGIDATRLDVRSLEQVRQTVVSLEADDAVTVDLYSGFVAQVQQRLGELSLLAIDADELRLRRASLSLVDAADALSQRRALVMSVLAGRLSIEAETRLQIGLYSREYTVAAANAATLLVGDNLERVRALSTSSVTESVNNAITRLYSDGPAAAIDADEWHDLASRQMDEVFAVASPINDEIRDQASGRAGSARLMTIITSVTAGVLFVLVLLAAWSAVVASRGRVRALRDHRRLVDGLLRWFGVDALPNIDGIEVEARYVPAAVSGAGGDWYDIFRDHDGRLAIVIGDVAGHGADTVAMMAELRNMIRAFARSSAGGPAYQLEQLDESVNRPHLTTVFYAVLDVPSHSLIYSRAGHVPGVIRRKDGATEVLYEGGDVPVGVDVKGSRSERVVSFGGGDALVLFTDGLVESPGVDVLDAIHKLAGGAIADTGSNIVELADRMLEARPQGDHVDDASILIVRLTDPAKG